MLWCPGGAQCGCNRRALRHRPKDQHSLSAPTALNSCRMSMARERRGTPRGSACVPFKFSVWFRWCAGFAADAPEISSTLGTRRCCDCAFRPLVIDPTPLLDAHDIKPGLRLVHASYPADRRYRLMADLHCHLVGVVQRLWLTDCDTHPASSGGPIFARVGDTLKLAAIVIGGAQRRFTLAVPATEWEDLARGVRVRCSM